MTTDPTPDPTLPTSDITVAIHTTPSITAAFVQYRQAVHHTDMVLSTPTPAYVDYTKARDDETQAELALILDITTRHSALINPPTTTN